MAISTRPPTRRWRAVALLVVAFLATLGVATAAADTPQYRPAYHFSPAKNWMNDPNGLVFHKGVYHLFFQYNPLGNVWGNMSWGHAVSHDLLTWKQLPVAIPTGDTDWIFSGSIVVDENNTSGFGNGLDGQPPFVLDPNIVWSGRRYLLVYQETDEVRYAISIHQNWRNMSTSEIAGLWIEEDGSVGAPFRITSTEEIEMDPVLAAVEDGLIALAYVRGPDALVKSRLFVRILSDTVRTRRPARR